MKLGWEATGSGVMCEGSPYTSLLILSSPSTTPLYLITSSSLSLLLLSLRCSL